MPTTWVFLKWFAFFLFLCGSLLLSLSLSGCDVNSPRKPGPNGEGDEEARDGQSPLHLASCWGLEEVVQCLLEFAANVNAQVLTRCKHRFLTYINEMHITVSLA